MIRPSVLIAGLVLAIVANILIVAGAIGGGPLHGAPVAGNVAAIVVCAGAIWIVRNRERFGGR